MPTTITITDPLHAEALSGSALQELNNSAFSLKRFSQLAADAQKASLAAVEKHAVLTTAALAAHGVALAPGAAYAVQKDPKTGAVTVTL